MINKYRLTLAALSGFFLSTFIQAEEKQPNIIFIMADDMGYGDIQKLNPSSKIATPHLDRLVGEGMTFTDAHSPSSVCTPTRYGVVTGRYCWRSKMTRGVLNGYGAPIIEKDRLTVADALTEQGYTTAVIGKWHLGLGFQKTDGKWDWSKPVNHCPLDLGFKHSYVIPASLDFPPYVYVDGRNITGQPDRIQPKQSFPGFLREGELGSDFSIIDCLDHLTSKATTYIKEQAKHKQPFFLYLPLTAPHKPVSPHPRFQGKSGLGPYGDFVMQTDWTVGEILNALDESGIAKNTLVLYTSDNGSFMHRQKGSALPDHVSDPTIQAYNETQHTANGPLRGTKTDIWEGGHRVPFLVRWPGKVKAGSRCDSAITQTDFFSTAVDASGGKLPPPAEAAQDSISFMPLLRGNEKGWKRPPIIHHSGGAIFAIRDGDWKLILGNGSGGREEPKGKRFQRPWALFNLKQDIGETNDLSKQHPDIVTRLEKRALEIFMANRSR